MTKTFTNMKKTFTFWKSLFLLFALIVGTSSAWATETTVTWTASTNALGSLISSVNGTASGTISTGSFSWNYTRTLLYLANNKKDFIQMNSEYMQCGSSNAKESLSFTTSNIPGTIKSISVNCASASAKHNLSITVGGTSYYNGATPSWSNSSGSIKTGTGTSSGTIEISFSLTSPSSQGGALYIKSISVTYDDRPIAPNFDVPGGEFAEPFDLTITSATGTTLKYTTDGSDPTSSGTAVAVASNSATVSIAATTRVRAIAIKGTDISDEKDVTYTYVQKETPTFTIDPTSLNLKVGQEGNISLTTNSDGEVTFSCEDAHVTLTGSGNSRTVSANAAGEYTVDVSVASTSTYIAKAGTITVTVTKYDTSLTIDGSGITTTDIKNGRDAVTLTASVTYGDPAEAVPSASVTWSSNKPNIVSVTTTGDVKLIGIGEATITATFAGTDAYNGCTNTYDLTVTDTRENNFSWDLSTNSYVTNPGPTESLIQWTDTRTIMKNERTGTETAVNNYIPTTQTSTRFYKDNKLTITPQTGYRITSVEFDATTAGYANTLANSNWTNATATAYNGSNVFKVVVTPTDGSQAFSATIGNTCGFTDVNVYYVATSVTLTPGKTYTTLTSAYNLDFTSVNDDLKAFIAVNGISGTTVKMTQVNKVPAGTGLVLKATTPGAAVNVPVFDGTGADNVSGNMMAGSATATTDIAENGGYILKDGVFQPASAGTLAAGKAYLAIAVSSARSLEMSFEDTTTGINGVEEVAPANMKTRKVVKNGRLVIETANGEFTIDGARMK